MYAIYRDNKRFNNKLFDTYEEARNYVRAWLNKNLGKRVMGIYGFSVKPRKLCACPN